MNYEAMKAWVDVAQFVWMIAATIWVFWGNKSAETGKRLKTVEDRTNSHNGKIIRLEEQVKHIPTHEELAEMQGDVKALQAQMDAISEALKGIDRQLQTINDYLLNRKP